MKKLTSILIILLAGTAIGAELPMKFLKALNQVETSGKTGAILGDVGKALGSFQIHKSYWRDAVKFDKTIGGKYEDCADYDYSVKVVTAYLLHYEKRADFESLARLHNGGPNWRKDKNRTDGYWKKVKRELDKNN